jgi:hypothetical protein
MVRVEDLATGIITDLHPQTLLPYNSDYIAWRDTNLTRAGLRGLGTGIIGSLTAIAAYGNIKGTVREVRAAQLAPGHNTGHTVSTSLRSIGGTTALTSFGVAVLNPFVGGAMFVAGAASWLIGEVAGHYNKLDEVHVPSLNEFLDSNPFFDTQPQGGLLRRVLSGKVKTSDIPAELAVGLNRSLHSDEGVQFMQELKQFLSDRNEKISEINEAIDKINKL